jgi:predicted phosphohydrolase
MFNLWVEGETHMKSLSEEELRLFQREAEKLGLDDSDLITELVRRFLRRQNRKKL